MILAETTITLTLNEMLGVAAAVSTLVGTAAVPVIVLLWKIQVKVSLLCGRLGAMQERMEEQCERLTRIERVVFTPNPGLRGAPA